MNDTFAKISSINDQNIYKILSGHKLFEPLNISEGNQIPYSPEHKLDEECWFVISSFSTKKFFPKILDNEFTSIDYSQLKKKLFDKISFIFCIQNDGFYFQKIQRSKIIRKSKFLELGEEAKVQEIANSFTVNNLPDAVYSKEQDVLIFRSLERISSIFKGIDILYREATDEETQQFLNSPFISLASNYSSDKVKKSNRRRIAMAQEKMAELSEDDKKMLFPYISNYCPSLKFNKEKSCFEISNEDDLKNLLYGIAEKYYTTPTTNQKRVANSTRKID